MGDDNILGMYVLRELHVNICDEMDYNMPRKKKSDGCPNHCPLLVLVHERLLEALRPAQHPRKDKLVIDLLHVRHAVAFEMLCKFLPWNLDAILQERAANKFASCLALQNGSSHVSLSGNRGSPTSSLWRKSCPTTASSRRGHVSRSVSFHFAFQLLSYRWRLQLSRHDSQLAVSQALALSCRDSSRQLCVSLRPCKPRHQMLQHFASGHRCKPRHQLFQHFVSGRHTLSCRCSCCQRFPSRRRCKPRRQLFLHFASGRCCKPCRRQPSSRERTQHRSVTCTTRSASCICVPHILPSPTYGAKRATKAWAYEWLGACKCYWQHTTASSAECISKFILQVLLAMLACLLCLFIPTGSPSKFACPLECRCADKLRETNVLKTRK